MYKQINKQGQWGMFCDECGAYLEKNYSSDYMMELCKECAEKYATCKECCKQFLTEEMHDGLCVECYEYEQELLKEGK